MFFKFVEIFILVTVAFSYVALMAWLFVKGAEDEKPKYMLLAGLMAVLAWSAEIFYLSSWIS